MKRSRCLLLLIILSGLSLRLALAPYSAGSDLAQFYGFAGTMLEKKACFYAYADAAGFWTKGWPYPWPYVYGPVMAYLLAAVGYLVGGRLTPSGGTGLTTFTSTLHGRSQSNWSSSLQIRPWPFFCIS